MQRSDIAKEEKRAPGLRARRGGLTAGSWVTHRLTLICSAAHPDP